MSGWMPPDGDQLRHQVPPTWLQVREHRDSLAYSSEIIEVKFHPRLVRDRKQVQHGIGRAAEGNDDRDRILEGFASEDVARTDALPHQ